MIDFAINYSPQAAELITLQQIEVDFFKTPPWPDMIAEARKFRPVTVHFELRAGAGKLKKQNWQEIEKYLASTATRYVNLHLNAKIKDFPGKFLDEPPKILHQIVAQRLIEDVQVVVDQFGADRVIVENVPYRTGNPETKIFATVLPEIITQVVQNTGCGLLLDISHARISAQSLGLDPEQYIGQLPIFQLKELHFTGIHILEDGRLQDHLSLTPEDWGWLDWTLDQVKQGFWSKPNMLAFEYGGTGPFFAENTDRQTLIDQVPGLVQAVHAV
jgi:uncharacterized protein